MPSVGAAPRPSEPGPRRLREQRSQTRFRPGRRGAARRHALLDQRRSPTHSTEQMAAELPRCPSAPRRVPSNPGLIAAMEAGQADLATHEWVHFTPPSGLSDILDDACQIAGFQPHAAVRTEQAPSALALAREGLGLTLVPGQRRTARLSRASSALARSARASRTVGLHPSAAGPDHLLSSRRSPATPSRPLRTFSTTSAARSDTHSSRCPR
jgi:hypothetical protein